MGKVYSKLDETQAAWTEQQHPFFVATAPPRDGSPVNLFPKVALPFLRRPQPNAAGSPALLRRRQDPRDGRRYFTPPP